MNDTAPPPAGVSPSSAAGQRRRARLAVELVRQRAHAAPRSVPSTPSKVHSPTAALGGSAGRCRCRVDVGQPACRPRHGSWLSITMVVAVRRPAPPASASVVRIASSPTGSGAPSAGKLDHVAGRRVGAVGAEAGLGQFGELLGLAHEPGELACRADLFLAQPRRRTAARWGSRRPRPDPAAPRPRRLVLASADRRRALEQLLFGGDDGVHRRGRRVAGTPAARPAPRRRCCRPAWAGPASRVLTAPSPAVAGASGGAEVVATASAGQIGGVAVAVGRQGQPQRSPARQVQRVQRRRVGLQARQRRPALSEPVHSSAAGRTASTTGEVTRERASLTISLPAAACSRAD